MIICINNNKGGSLKTTATINLAGALAVRKKKVLVVDLDGQSNVALSFDINPDTLRTTVYDVLLGNVPADDAIIMYNKYIDILPSNEDMISFDFDVIGDYESFPEPFTLLKKALQELEKEYDYILLDTPPSLSLIVGNAFAWADKVVIPYTPEFYSSRSLMKVVEAITEFRTDHNSKLDILGILITNIKEHTTIHTEILEDTRKYAMNEEIHIFDTLIPHSIQYAKELRKELAPITLSKKAINKEKAGYYFELCDEILELIEGKVK